MRKKECAGDERFVGLEGAAGSVTNTVGDAGGSQSEWARQFGAEN